MQFESHLGHSRSPRQGFLLSRVYKACDGVPLTLLRGLWPGRRGGLFRCVGGGIRVLAKGPSASCDGASRPPLRFVLMAVGHHLLMAKSLC